MAGNFNINRKDETLTWQTVTQRIKLGFKLQEIEGELTSENILEFNDAIVIDPDYQREYRSSIADESSLIESALLEIPIPPIFLATQKYRGVQVLNVVDGQHRLRAFYRYINNMYSLKGLKLLPDFMDKSFSDLDMDHKTSLMSKGITCITFRDFPGKEFELEIFSRYNKGTKPLTPQEIRHAVYDSKTNDLVNLFCSKLVKDLKSPLAKAYAISKDRFQKKAIQENIFVILSIIEFGINQEFINDQGKTQKVSKSPQFAETYMKIKSEDKSNESYEISKSSLLEFNEFITKLTKITEYPFSREVYGVSERGKKFQVSISMILSAIFKKLKDVNFDFLLLEKDENLVNLSKYISILLNNSYLEDAEYRASTTNPIEIESLINKFDLSDIRISI
ncbi:DUF262 domain-containing protein [Pseudoalteromonas sp. 2CM28B]|uniref:DUF262 domain-containing protein n=1 Tax=Pseudoalteromonas sp. 2CM28B TaxID=2929851 RepID=UPI0020BD4B01|nr:DUF262 domain-containing protein [Pseudoalteromonas sp. 2CM28B]MCK8135508.1 DUF262 domain-containing protein [Pseudoalteromonas sp. 2CM28B]